MSLLDTLREKMNGAANYTVKKTGEVTGAARVRMEIRAQKARLARSFEDIGRAYYRKEKGLTQDDGAALAAAVAEADSIRIELYTLRRKLAALQDSVLCPHCGAQVPDTSIYCPICGVKLPEPTPAPKPPREEEAPVEIPAEEAPAEEASAEEELTEEEPTEEEPTEEEPTEEAPAEEASSKDPE